MSTTSCSSPSEDMSIRDVVHQERSVYDECEVPLQQLARLKDKLLRHSRAEDAAVKRIRDLEMQILALRSDLEVSRGYFVGGKFSSTGVIFRSPKMNGTF